jgi:hypothetical protein
MTDAQPPQALTEGQPLPRFLMSRHYDETIASKIQAFTVCVNKMAETIEQLGMSAEGRAVLLDEEDGIGPDRPA